MKRTSILILFVFIIAFSIIFWIDIVFFFQVILISVLIKLIVEYFLSRTKNYSFCSPYLDFAQLIYTCLIIFFTYYSTSGNGEIIPNLLIGDTLAYYNESIYFASIAENNFLNYLSYTNINYFFYQFLLSLLYIAFFGNFYFSGLMLSAFVGILNLLLLIKISELVKLKLPTLRYVMIFYIIFPHIIASSTTLLKDNFIVFSFLILIYSILKTIIVKPKFIYYFQALIAIILCALLRLPFVLVFIFVILYFYMLSGRLKITNLLYLVILLTTLFFLDIGSFSTNIYNDKTVFQAFQYEQSRIADSSVTGSGITNLLVGDYANSSLTLKIIKLPLALLVQYLNPINIFYFDHIIPWQYIDINLKIIWLLFLGPLLIFCFINYKSLSKIIKSILLISLFGYSFIAFLNGGIVPRYALCFMVLSVIPMGFIYQLIVTNVKYRLRFMRFFSIYIIIALLASSMYLFI